MISGVLVLVRLYLVFKVLGYKFNILSIICSATCSKSRISSLMLVKAARLRATSLFSNLGSNIPGVSNNSNLSFILIQFNF